jgi:serine/threonine protein kinase
LLITERLTAASERATSSIDTAATEFVAADPGTGTRRDRAGEVLAGRYRLIERIGMGGMGSVYRAIHTTIRKSVAVKVLDGSQLAQAEFAARFLREAQASSQLRHENIVDVTDFGETPDGSVFLVMEFLEGEDLSTTLDRDQMLPWPRVKRIILQVLSALSCAHRHGILHRDIKLENCYRVEQAGNPDFIKVLDFGNAKLIDGPTETQADFGDQAKRAVTAMGVIVGTAAYISPEQAEQLPLDARSDLYSLGVMFFELLTGRLPFEAATFMGVLSKHIHESPPSPRAICPQAKIPLRVEALILRLLAKRPSERYPSADALIAAISSIPDNAADTELPPWNRRSEERFLGRLAPLPRANSASAEREKNAGASATTLAVKRTVFARRPPIHASAQTTELPSFRPQRELKVEDEPQSVQDESSDSTASKPIPNRASFAELRPRGDGLSFSTSLVDTQSRIDVHEVESDHSSTLENGGQSRSPWTEDGIESETRRRSTPTPEDDASVVGRIREPSGAIVDHQKLARLEANLEKLADTSMGPDDSLVAALARAQPRRTWTAFALVAAILLGSALTLVALRNGGESANPQSARVASAKAPSLVAADKVAAAALAQETDAIPQAVPSLGEEPDVADEALNEPKLMIQFVGDTVVRQRVASARNPSRGNTRNTDGAHKKNSAKSKTKAEGESEEETPAEASAPVEQLTLPHSLISTVRECGRQHGAIPGDRLLLTFEVNSAGTVTSAAADGNKRTSQDLARCAEAELRKSHFSGFSGSFRRSVTL